VPKNWRECVWNVTKHTTKRKYQETNNPFHLYCFFFFKYSLRVHLTQIHSEILRPIQMCNQLCNLFLPLYFTTLINHIKIKNPASICYKVTIELLYPTTKLTILCHDQKTPSTAEPSTITCCSWGSASFGITRSRGFMRSGMLSDSCGCCLL
jgi:hypothetical protein